MHLDYKPLTLDIFIYPPEEPNAAAVGPSSKGDDRPDKLAISCNYYRFLYRWTVDGGKRGRPLHFRMEGLINIIYFVCTHSHAHYFSFFNEFITLLIFNKASSCTNEIELDTIESDVKRHGDTCESLYYNPIKPPRQSLQSCIVELKRMTESSNFMHLNSK